MKLNHFIKLGTFIFHKIFLTTRVAVNFLDEAIYSTLIYHLGTPHLRSNTRKCSLEKSILLAKIKEYTMLYITDKFQGV